MAEMDARMAAKDDASCQSYGAGPARINTSPAGRNCRQRAEHHRRGAGSGHPATARARDLHANGNDGDL